MKKCIFYLFIFDLVFCLNISAQVTPTNEWVNFFSATSTFNGQPISVGSIVSAYDSDGILCGSFEVHTTGQYGFLAVYRDDSYTSGIDEGAEPGDTLTFFINNHIALVQGPGAPIWTANGDVVELNLEALSNYPPVIYGFPDSLTFKADSSVILYLNDYVEDLNDPDSTLHWTISGNEFLLVDLDDAQKMVTLSAPVHYWGTETLIFTVSDDSSAGDSDTIIVRVIKVVGINGDLDGLLPKEFCLYQNYPNPFNPTTTIKYELPKTSHVILSIYNLNGQIIEGLVNKMQEPGFYSINWDARNISTGVYFYRIQADGFQQVKKMLLIK
ncbi:T9SS type A sorting domain-containing protein [Patescibacteria group bacterium]|nr:T9SS type A sorting domain-containing protein [Patescibacteria group bacterium]